MNPDCPYCGAVSKRVTGEALHPDREDLADKVFYQCRPCKAWVGCHPGTEVPLGRLADQALRRAKQDAHAALDLLWRSGRMTRRASYAWLSERTGVPREACHIGMFDVEQCERVVAVVGTFLEEI